MKRNVCLIVLACAASWLLSSCDQTEIELPAEKLQFELYPDVTSVEEGRSVSGVQELELEETKTYILKSQYVTRMMITSPRGWDCRFYPASEEATITAPTALADTVDAAGEVVVELWSGRGEKERYELEVKVAE